MNHFDDADFKLNKFKDIVEMAQFGTANLDRFVTHIVSKLDEYGYTGPVALDRPLNFALILLVDNPEIQAILAASYLLAAFRDKEWTTSLIEDMIRYQRATSKVHKEHSKPDSDNVIFPDLN